MLAQSGAPWQNLLSYSIAAQIIQSNTQSKCNLSVFLEKYHVAVQWSQQALIYSDIQIYTINKYVQILRLTEQLERFILASSVYCK